jgi:hypothetical protein
MVIDLPIMEDEMEVNFTVNATDVETDMINLTYEFEEGDYYTLELMNDTMPYWFHFMGAENMYGMWAANLTVSDGVNDAMEVVWFNVSMVNDAPTIMFDVITAGDEVPALTGVDINVSVTAADVEMDELTYMWYIDDVMVADWDMDYFLYNWTTEGMYVVSVKVNDGDLDSEMIDFTANITKAGPDWTAENIVVNYTEAAGDVAKADADGIMDYSYSDLRYTDEWDGIDITAIATALDGDNLVITITFAAAPLEVSSGLTEFLIPFYSLYFVKSTFTEPTFTEATPDMDFAPVMDDVLWSDELEFYSAISGNDMIYTIPLDEISDAGVTPEEFNIFFNAYLIESSLDGLNVVLEAGYDSAGLGAATHVTPPVDDDDDDDDDDEDGFPWLIVVIIVIVLVIVIILVVVFMMKGKKGEEEEVAPPEEEMPPAEGEEIPMEGEMPMEGEEPPMEGYEEPAPMEEGEVPMPEEPVPEEPVPEEPIPEEPIPEEPVPEEPIPEEPAPPVPPQPEPPMPPQ